MVPRRLLDTSISTILSSYNTYFVNLSIAFSSNYFVIIHSGTCAYVCLLFFSGP